MKKIEGNNANELFIKISREMLKNGHKSAPRSLETIELTNIWLTLHNPIRSIVSLSSRNLNYEYLNGEMAWYLRGGLDVNEIGKHSKFWFKIANPNNTVNSNYGYIALRELINGKSQFEWCINRLKKDSDTRQAIINYNQPKHKYDGNKDFVCTIAQLFRNNNGSLDSTVLIRSNDLIYGLSYDLPWFTHLQNQMAHETNSKLGVYNHFAASLHVYRKHWGMLEEMAQEEL